MTHEEAKQYVAQMDRLYRTPTGAADLMQMERHDPQGFRKYFEAYYLLRAKPAPAKTSQ